MKKIYYGALALLALAGCTNDDFVTSNDEVKGSIKSVTSINAVIEQSPSTRAYFQNEVTVKWIDNDEIGVYSDKQAEPVPFTYQGETKGTFEGEAVAFDQSLYAYYPFHEVKVDEQNPTLLHLVVNGNWGGSSSWDESGMVEFTEDDHTDIGDVYAKGDKLFMVAKGGSRDLTFKQTMGVLKFSLKGTSSIESVEFSGNNKETLSGEAVIDMSEEEPIVRFTRQEPLKNSLRVYFGKELNETEASDFYFRVPVTTFEKGFTFTIYYHDDNGDLRKLQKVVKSPLTIKRGYLKAYAGLDTDEELEEMEVRRLEELRLQREALLEFYHALNGDEWSDNENWDSDLPFDQWAHVGTDEDGNVTSIHIWDDRNLEGEIPESIAKLTYLTDLGIGYTNLRAVPDVIFNLPLQSLELPGNQLQGNLPAALSKATDLWFVNLENNSFEGEIPASWFSELNRLRYLYLDYNRLTGTITKEMQSTKMWQGLYVKRVADQQQDYGITIEGAVREIQLNKYSLLLEVGQAAQLAVTAILPEDAENKAFSWDISWMSSDNYENDPVFTVDENGLVIAVREGEGYVRVRALDNNGADAYCSIRVVKEISEGQTEDFSGSGAHHGWDN